MVSPCPIQRRRVKRNARLTTTANNRSGDTTETPTEPKDGIRPSLVGRVRNDGDAPTSDAHGSRKDALHQADDDGLLQGRRGAEESAGERAPEERDKEDEALTVFLRDGGPEEGREELGEEEGGDEETGGEADVGALGHLVKALDHEDEERRGDVGGEKFAEEGDGEHDHGYLWERGGVSVARLLQRARYQRPFLCWSGRRRACGRRGEVIPVCERTVSGQDAGMTREYVSKRGEARRRPGFAVGFVLIAACCAAEYPRRALKAGRLSVRLWSRVRARHRSKSG